MSTTDNYTYFKSMEAQGEEKYTPFSSLDWNYITDSNNGIYQASNATIEFNLQNLYSATKYIDCSQAYLAIPITLVSCFSTGSATVAPSTFNLNVFTSLKIIIDINLSKFLRKFSIHAIHEAFFVLNLFDNSLFLTIIF